MTVVVETVSLAGCTCDGHERMRGVAAFWREKLGLLSPDEVLGRWAAGAPDAELDSLRAGVHARKLRATALKAG